MSVKQVVTFSAIAAGGTAIGATPAAKWVDADPRYSRPYITALGGMVVAYVGLFAGAKDPRIGTALLGVGMGAMGGTMIGMLTASEAAGDYGYGDHTY